MKASTMVTTGLLVAAALIGCSTAGRIDVDDIPEFYLNPPISDDSIFGVGDARMSTLSMSRTMALSRARDDVARQVAITSAITDYAQAAGEAGKEQTIQFVETVSRQIVDVTLSGLRQVEAHVGRRGTVYAMVEYPMSELRAQAASVFERNEAAAFAEFKSADALAKLESELENNPPRAGGDR